MIFLYLWALLFSLSSAWAEGKRLAILDFDGVSIDSQVLLRLGDQARLASLNFLPSQEYNIISRENMLQILQDMGKDVSCLRGMCEVAIARNMGADFVISGDILFLEVHLGDNIDRTARPYSELTSTLGEHREVTIVQTGCFHRRLR